MTTAATIEHYRQKTVRKMKHRLESVDLVAICREDSDLFILYGTDSDGITDSGLLTAPGGMVTWTVPQLLSLLDLIATHGRSTNYRIRLRSYARTWSATLIVQAGRIALDEAARHAEMHSAELLECINIT